MLSSIDTGCLSQVVCFPSEGLDFAWTLQKASFLILKCCYNNNINLPGRGNTVVPWFDKKTRTHHSAHRFPSTHTKHDVSFVLFATSYENMDVQVGPSSWALWNCLCLGSLLDEASCHSKNQARRTKPVRRELHWWTIMFVTRTKWLPPFPDDSSTSSLNGKKKDRYLNLRLRNLEYQEETKLEATLCARTWPVRRRH